jgi:O-antigen chain-terminating methyltransferase
MENERLMAKEASNPDEVEIAALFARLRDEVARREPAPGPGATSVGALASPTIASDRSELPWAVTADRPFLYKPGRWGRMRGMLLVPVKAVLRKLMRWYVEPAFAQQRDFNSGALRAFDELSARIDFVSAELDKAARELREAMAPMARSSDEADERLHRLERRLRRSGDEPPSDRPPQASTTPIGEAGPDYFAFESRMRGSSGLIRERQALYADQFREAAPVLDLGCGRGEFLTLLREAGVDARGIDADPEMVAHCREEGLAVEQADAAEYLSGLGDSLLGGVFCAHVLEHFEPRALFRLLELAVAKLRPSGLFVAETPNPLSFIALANFSADLTHNKPLHPATLSFLARQAGFKEVTLQFMSEPAEDERLRLIPLPEGPEFTQAQVLLDANVNRLNDVVFGPQDYAVLART